MNLVIVGGGTAGWLTALTVKKYYNDPKINVVVIESEEIGILGAGEGTVPSFPSVLQDLQIDVSELVRNCKATFKSGINFENWNGDGKKYFHSFGMDPQVSMFNIVDNLLFTKQIADGRELKKINFVEKLCDENKLPFQFRNNINCLFESPMASFYNISSWALHFDARLLAKYFRMIAEQRGIIRIEGKITNISNDSNGNIQKLQLEDGKEFYPDFVFDCSGFARLIIGKHYQTKWKSYSKHLPMKSAVPFFISHDGNTSPKTDAIAMKYGWIWRIPVEDRYGCGYVFDSDYITADQALQEAEEYFGMKLESPKTFKFDAGAYEKVLVKNCLAVGLSQNFVEPLEATSIWVSNMMLNDFLDCKGITSNSESFANVFNERCGKKTDQVRDFLYLHYLTKRNDSDFWKEFRVKNTMIDSVQEYLDMMNDNQNIFLEKQLFLKESWLQVAAGLELISQEKCKHIIGHCDMNQLEAIKQSLLQNQKNMAKQCLTHSEVLQYLRG